MTEDSQDAVDLAGAVPRVALVALGSWGDIRPFVLLGQRLRGTGFEVTLVTQPEWRQVAELAKLHFEPLCHSREQEEESRLLEEIHRMGSREQILAMLDFVFLRDPARQFECLRAIGRTNDLVLVHHSCYLARVLLEATKVRAQSISLWPGALAGVGGDLGLESRLDGFDALLEKVQEAASEACRSTTSLEVDERLTATDSCWVAASRHLALADKVTERLDFTGDWTRRPKGVLRPDLEYFLKHGEPPIMVGFGSMALAHGARVAQLCAVSLSEVGCRAILPAEWAEAIEGKRDWFFSPNVDHALVLSRVACFVHHCGAGTAHASARGGAVSIPVPHLVDQPYWARSLADQEAATPALPYSELDAASLCVRIRTALESADIKAGASTLASTLSEEDGLEVTARRVAEICS